MTKIYIETKGNDKKTECYQTERQKRAARHKQKMTGIIN